MSEFLDKLAMGVSEWSPAIKLDKGWSWIMWANFLTASNTTLDKRYTKFDWLKRRKELINEPSDADAPDWAQWVAQTGTGNWCWMPVEPTLCQEELYWFLGMGDVIYERAATGKLPAGHDWRKTLRKVERKACDDVDELGHAHYFGADFGAGKSVGRTALASVENKFCPGSGTASTNTIERQRQEFEVWAKGKSMSVSIRKINATDGVIYNDDFTNYAWCGWLASRGVWNE